MSAKPDIKSKKFLSFLADGLASTDHGLGDRSTYVGSSDVGQCLKKSYLSKMLGDGEKGLQKLITLERGHVAEGVIQKALDSRKLKYETQHEVAGKGDLSFIKTHIDFVVHNSRECVILEVKTVSSSIAAPYESWVLQTQLQLGLLRANTGRSCRGYIVAMNLNTGETQEFPIEFNETLFAVAVERAKFLWESVKNMQEPDGECGDLCPHCPFKGRCSALRAGADTLPDEIAAKVLRLKALNGMDKEIKALKDEIKAYLESAAIKKATTQDVTVTLIHRRGRETVDAALLKEVAPDLYSVVACEGDGYSYIKVA